MIKLFRNIRKKLIEQSKVRSYFFYAIGEIILVVIGILIALQVNNWNESRKRQLEISKLLYDIEQDLIANYYQANEALSFYKKQDSIAKLIADNKLTKKDYTDNYSLNYYVASWENYIPSDKNLNQFVDAEKIIDLKYKPILEAAKNLQFYKDVLYDAYSNLEENIDDNTNAISSQLWYVKNDSISTVKRLDYMVDSSEYKIIALRYWIMTQNYCDKIARYRAQSIATLVTIRRTYSNYSSSQIKELFLNLEMPSFLKYACQTPELELKHLRDVRSSALYGNLTDKEVRLYVSNNEGREVNDFKIGPYKFRTIPGSQYFGIDGDNNVLVQLLDESGNCIQKYGIPENGYLLIE